VLGAFDRSLRQGVRLADHHPLSCRFLQQGGPLRASVERFLSDGALSPELEPEIALLRMVPIVERCVEGLHRLVKIAAEHIKLGGAAVSLAIRGHELNENMLRDASFYETLVGAFGQVRCPRQAAARLRVTSHPLCLNLINTKNTQSWKWLVTLAQASHAHQAMTSFSIVWEVVWVVPTRPLKESSLQ